MMNNSAVVILSAGVGSRMGDITNKTSKCIIDLDGITPLEHTIKSFVSNGVKNIIIVIGHYYDKVKESVINSVLKMNDNEIEVTFVLNEKYGYHGCEYSLASSSIHFNKYDTVYITEGDLLMSSEYVKKIINYSEGSSVLLRPASFINETRSVVAINDLEPSSIDLVNEFVYDPNHLNIFDKLDMKKDLIIGESMQLWKFTNNELKLLTKELLNYFDMANNSDKPVSHSGLYSINKVIKFNPLKAIEIIDNNRWINLNTKNDVEIAKKLDWLNR